jgi:hypothetical protein
VDPEDKKKLEKIIMKSLELMKTMQDSNDPGLTRQLIDKIDIPLIASRIWFLLNQLDDLCKMEEKPRIVAEKIERGETGDQRRMSIGGLSSNTLYGSFNDSFKSNANA